MWLLWAVCVHVHALASMRVIIISPFARLPHLHSTSQRQHEALAATTMALSQQVQMLLEDKVC